jgi:hypothetical protein
MDVGMDSAEQSNVDKSDPLLDLASQLDLITPKTPLLSAEDRLDLALLDKLTQIHTRLQQVLGLETEIADTETWNFNAATQLLSLANQISRIPFYGRTEVFDLEPTSVAQSAPAASSAKGKGRLEDEPKKRSIYHMLPDLARKTWAGSSKLIVFTGIHFNS